MFGRELTSGNGVYVGTFTVWLPTVPAVGWILNAADLDEVNWEEATVDPYRKVIEDKGVAFGIALAVRRIGIQLDEEGSCDAVRIDCSIEESDPTTEDRL